MFRRLLIAIGVLLGAYHVWLFGGQLWRGELADVSLVARWLIAVGLVLGLRALRQQDAPLFWGRKAVALWLLAALLHGPALADRLAGEGASTAPGIAATLVQAAAPTVVLAGLVLLLALAVGVRRRLPMPVARVVEPALAGPFDGPARVAFAPRPPPLR